MPDHDSDVAAAATSFHEDIPHRFQVSLTMSMQTRDSLRAVRDAVNDACDERVFTLDDVVHLALEAATEYDASVADGEIDDAAALRPLTAILRRETADASVRDGE